MKCQITTLSPTRLANVKLTPVKFQNYEINTSLCIHLEKEMPELTYELKSYQGTENK